MYLMVCSFYRPHALENSCCANMFWDSKSEVCGEWFPERDSKIVSCNYWEDAGPAFCSMIFFFLLGRHKSTSMKIDAGLLKKRKFIISFWWIWVACLRQVMSTSQQKEALQLGLSVWTHHWYHLLLMGRDTNLTWKKAAAICMKLLT